MASLNNIADASSVILPSDEEIDYDLAISSTNIPSSESNNKEQISLKPDAKKLEELRQKAIKSAFAFNADLQAVRKSERIQYWESNTNIIHSPLNKWMRVAKEYTKPSIYPVYLVPGQYTDYYKKFDSFELRSLPLNTVLNTKRLFPPKRDMSPPPIKFTDEELNGPKEEPNLTNGKNLGLNSQKSMSNSSEQKDEKGGFPLHCESPKIFIGSDTCPAPPKLSKICTNNEYTSKKNSTTFFPCPKLPQQIASTSKPIIKQTTIESSSLLNNKDNIPIISKNNIICSICQLSDAGGLFANKSSMVRCSSCQQQMHSSCIDMSQLMVEMIRQYDWVCIDCKKCYVCQQPDQEAAMMCCDLCDRGYHTFCIGLDQPPNGTWHCPKCKENNHNIITTTNSNEINQHELKKELINSNNSSNQNINSTSLNQLNSNKKPQSERKRGRPRKKLSTDDTEISSIKGEGESSNSLSNL